MSPTNDSFPHAPEGWSVDKAEAEASDMNIELTEDHWELVRGLQEYYDKVDFHNLRQITDALDEHFHAKGGMKYLYTIVPGPVATGCRLAGLQVPAGAVDKSFGSVA